MVYKLFFIAFIGLCCSCTSSTKNPLIGLESGLWAPSTASKIGIRNTGMEDSVVYYDAPIWVIGNHPDTLYTYYISENACPVSQDKEGNWSVYFFNNFKIETSQDKNTLFCFFEDEKGLQQKIQYTQVLPTSSITKETVNSLRENLMTTTWASTSNNKVIFYDFPEKKNQVTALYASNVNFTDTLNIDKKDGLVLFKQIKDFVFITFPWQPIEGLSVLKNSSNNTLELLHLDKQSEKPTILLEKDTVVNIYIDSIRSSVKKANQPLH